MLGTFECFTVDWEERQEGLEIPPSLRWNEYRAPKTWLSTMIARSFTNLLDVRSVLHREFSQQLGRMDSGLHAYMMQHRRSHPAWRADPRCNATLLDMEDEGLSGTFAFMLPFSVDRSIIELPFSDAKAKILELFGQRTKPLSSDYLDPQEILALSEIIGPGIPGTMDFLVGNGN